MPKGRATERDLTPLTDVVTSGDHASRQHRNPRENNSLGCGDAFDAKTLYD